jgi:hypothetical protein
MMDRVLGVSESDELGMGRRDLVSAFASAPRSRFYPWSG